MSGSNDYYSQLGQLRSVTDGWRTMPGPVRPLSETTNELTQGAPTWADAWEHNKAAYQDWAEKQRIAGVAAGEIDPETGWPTPAGARSAATSTAMGLVMGSTAPEFKAPRIANPLRAYHGSPHEFPPTERNPLGEFDPAKVGTGEGAQVYGTGAAYLAENEGIARHYRDQLSQMPIHDLNAMLLGFQPYLSIGKEATAENIQTMLAGHPRLAAIADDPDVVRDIATMVGGHDLSDNTHSKAAIDATSRLDTKLGKLSHGHMYEAEVHIDPEHMLHWDLPLSQQSKYVQERLGKVGGLEGYRDPTGELIYQHLASPPHGSPGYGVNDQAAASEQLRDAGIPALRYRDANSRDALDWHITPPDQTTAGDWMVKNNNYNSKGLHFTSEAEARAALAEKRSQIKHNFVVFDPKHIDIVRRYGIGALIGGGAAAGAAQGGE